MDLRQLRYFLTIVEEGQITLAAKKLNMAQPPLSQQLKNMENEIGSKLFIRDGRKLELTEAGRTLYEKGQFLINKFDETLTEVMEIGEGLRGTLNLGCVMSCICYLPDRIFQFNEKYPDVKLSIFAGDPYRLIQYVQERTIELAIVRSPIDTTNCEEIILDDDPFVFIIPSCWDKLRDRSSITMKEITSLPLIALRRVNGIGVYEVVLEEFRRHGLEPNFTCESPDATILLSLVGAGLGGVLLPQSVLYSFPKEKVRVLNIIDCQTTTKTSVIWQKDRYLSNAARRFIDMFR